MVVPMTETPTLLDLIRQAVSNPALDVGKLERLLSLYERVEARTAETAFNNAMTAAQIEIRPIAADANNPQTKSKYASYLALDNALRPIYTSHGFSLSFDTGDGAPADHIRALCYVAHNAGFTRTYRIDIPSDGKGAKGGDVMTKTHATGAAVTYSQRYLLKMVFNIAVGEDGDGNKAGGANTRITEKQAETIRELIDRSGSDIEKFCSYFNIEAVPELLAKDYDRAVAAINLREKKATGK